MKYAHHGPLSKSYRAESELVRTLTKMVRSTPFGHRLASALPLSLRTNLRANLEQGVKASSRNLSGFVAAAQRHFAPPCSAVEKCRLVLVVVPKFLLTQLGIEIAIVFCRFAIIETFLLKTFAFGDDAIIE